MGVQEDREELRKIIRHINETWTSGRAEQLGAAFHPEMVLGPTSDALRCEGRKAVVQSYLDYCDSDQTLRFEADDSHVDLFGDTAVATTRFELDYAVGADVYTEKGQDVMVFVRDENKWLAVWRTLHWESRCDE